MLSEGNEQPIDLDPVLARESLLQRVAGCFGRGRAHEPPSVRNPVDMDIDADLCRAAGNPECEVRALWSDTAKGCHYLEVAR